MNHVYLQQTLAILQHIDLPFLESILPRLIKKECNSGLVYFELKKEEDEHEIN